MSANRAFLVRRERVQGRTRSRSFARVATAALAGLAWATGLFAGEPISDPGSSPLGPPGRLGAGFSGELPEFVVHVPDSKSEVSGDTVGRLGLSWVRDWLADTPHESDAPLVRSPILPQFQTASDIWFAGRLAFTPVGAAAGLIHGGLAGESGRKIDRAIPSITNAMAELQIPNRFEPLLLALLQEKSRGLTPLRNRLPHESTFHRPGLMDDLAPPPDEWRGLREARVDVSSFEGADAAIVLRVVSWGLMGRHGRNPPLSLHLTVKATLVNLRDRTRGKEIYAVFESRPQKFVAWAADDAREFRNELRRGIQSLADQIAARVPAPPPASSPRLVVGAPDI